MTQILPVVVTFNHNFWMISKVSQGQIMSRTLFLAKPIVSQLQPSCGIWLVKFGNIASLKVDGPGSKWPVWINILSSGMKIVDAHEENVDAHEENHCETGWSLKLDGLWNWTVVKGQLKSYQKTFARLFCYKTTASANIESKSVQRNRFGPDPTQVNHDHSRIENGLTGLNQCL